MSDLSGNRISFSVEDNITNDKIKKLESELTDLKAKYQKAKRTIDFYATYSPFQFPEGYYEICIEKGVGGHNRFGTLARQTLEELGEKE